MVSPTPTITPVSSPTPTAAPLVVITEDDFEAGTTNGGDGYWQNAWSLRGDAFIISGPAFKGPARSGSFHLMLRSEGEATRSIDLSRESTVLLQFWARADSLERTDRVEAQVCARRCQEDASWTAVASWADGDDDRVYHMHRLVLPGEMLTREFSLRFKAEMSSRDDWVFIDDVAFVSAMPGPTPTPTPTPQPTPTFTPRPTRTPVPTLRLNITMEDDFSFGRDKSSVRAGRRVTFAAVNEDNLRFHTFTLVPSKEDKAQEFANMGLDPGEAASRTITAPSGVSSLYYYCTVPGHETLGMFGTFTVTP